MRLFPHFYNRYNYLNTIGLTPPTIISSVATLLAFSLEANTCLCLYGVVCKFIYLLVSEKCAAY